MPCLGCVRADSGLGHPGARAGITLANGVLFSGGWGASTVTFPGAKFLRFKYGFIRRLGSDKVASSPQLLMFAMVPFVVFWRWLNRLLTAYLRSCPYVVLWIYARVTTFAALLCEKVASSS